MDNLARCCPRTVGALQTFREGPSGQRPTRTSAAGPKTRALNNTWVFARQDAVLALAVAALALLGPACRPSARRSGADGSVGDAGPAPRVPPPPTEGPVRLPAAHLPELGLPPPEPTKPGGTLRVHLDTEPANLNPLVDGDASVMRVVRGLVYDTLIECRGDNYVPSLAERWDVSPDGLRIMLYLRSGVRWHDRRFFGVNDVQATIEPLLRSGPTVPLVRADLGDIITLEIASSRSIRLNLRRPSDLALRALCDIPILPDHLVRGWAPETTPITRQPVGTGPFRFAAWERGKRIRLVRAKESWRTAALDEVSFEIDTDGARALARTRRGDIDILPRVLDVHYPEQVEPATLRDSIALYQIEPDRYSFLAVNHRHRPLDDPRFRRALALLWDRDRFAREAHRALARPIGAPTFGPEVPPTSFDRTRAIALLEEAGYRDSDSDGIREFGGKPLRLTALQPAGTRNANLELRAYMFELRKAGVLLDLVPADAAAVAARVRGGDFDLAPLVWEGRPDEDPSVLFGAGGLHNLGGYRSEQVEAQLAELRRAMGPAARRPLLAALARLLEQDQPVIFLYRHDLPMLVANRVHDLFVSRGQLDFRHVWVDP